MEPRLDIAARQLARMRGMNAAYHSRFFSDIRFGVLLILGLLAAGSAISPWLYLAVPVVAVMGAAQTAFDASYLIFSRHYATRLEQYINCELGEGLLVAHRLEDTYLFPLDDRKIVTLALGPGFTWFGFMTAFYTTIGFAAYVLGVVLSLHHITNETAVLVGGVYLIGLALVTLTAVGVGAWWFVGGEGERRLRTTLDSFFPAPSSGENE